VKASLYIETSVVSYLTARPSRDIVMAGHQASTADWWEKHRARFDVFVSSLVWDEASKGDTQAVKKRLKILRPFPWLQVKRDAIVLSKALVASGAFPDNAQTDALHVALAAAHGINFLLTWNFTHIANAGIETKIRTICEEHGVMLPVICSPDELTQI
jgi:predicted nucleic acid-binding protein